MIIIGIIKDYKDYYNFSLEITNHNSPWFIELNKDNELLTLEEQEIFSADYNLMIKDNDNNIVVHLDNNDRINPIELLYMLDNLNCTFNITDITLNDYSDYLPVEDCFTNILLDNYDYNDGYHLFEELKTGLCSENFLIDLENLYKLYLNSPSFYEMMLNFELQYCFDPDNSNICYFIAQYLINIYLDTDKLKAAI